MLYLLSLYSRPAQTGGENEEWIRKSALMVLVYEGIVARTFDYDYAPSSAMVEGRRLYLNVSQEGKGDIDFLREEELVNGLKLASKEYMPVTCYQISAKGLDLIKKISKTDKDSVHELVYAPGSREVRPRLRPRCAAADSAAAAHPCALGHTQRALCAGGAWRRLHAQLHRDGDGGCVLRVQRLRAAVPAPRRTAHAVQRSPGARERRPEQHHHPR